MAMSFPFPKERLARGILPSIHVCDGHLIWVVDTAGSEDRAKFHGFFGELRDQVLCAKSSLETKI